METIHWINPQSMDELKQIMDDKLSPLIIFKHSARCPVSRFALKRFEEGFDLTDTRTVMINVIQQRELSNFVAEQWNIKHESPQALMQTTSGNHSSLSHEAIAIPPIKEFLNH